MKAANVIRTSRPRTGQAAFVRASAMGLPGQRVVVATPVMPVGFSKLGRHEDRTHPGESLVGGPRPATVMRKLVCAEAAVWTSLCQTRLARRNSLDNFVIP